MLVVEYLAEKYNFSAEDAMDDIRTTIFCEPQDLAQYFVQRLRNNVAKKKKKESQIAQYFVQRLRKNVATNNESRMAQ